MVRAGIRAVAPGKLTTLNPFSIAKRASSYPGSLIIGVPLSLTSPTFLPFDKYSNNFSLLFDSLNILIVVLSL